MYYSLQIGRAIAAVFVLLFHLGGIIASERYFGISEFYIPFSFGASGVEFFFVLSGFIIYEAHKSDLSQPHKITEYVKKRFIRIFPTYWLIFSMVYITAYFTSLNHSMPTDIMVILKSLFLLPQDMAVVGGTGAPVIPVAWSLQYEMLFYFIFGCLIWNKNTIFILLIFSIYMYINYFEYFTIFPMNFLMNTYVILFFMGIVISKITEYNLQSIYIKLFGIIGFIVYGVLILDSVSGIHFLKEFNIILYGLSSSFIVLFIVKVEQKGYNFKRFKFLSLLGDSSYSLYLMHYPIMVTISKFFVVIGFTKLGLTAAFIAYIFIFSCCILMAILFYIKVEKPMVRFLKNRFEI